MATVEERVKGLVAERLGVNDDQVTPAASFTEDLNADSLDLVELIMAFEEEFSSSDSALEISDEDAENIRTVQNAVDFLKSKGARDGELLV